MKLLCTILWSFLRTGDFVSIVNQNLNKLTAAVNLLTYTANYHNSNLNQLTN